MSRYLVTGGAGHISSVVVAHRLRAGHRVTVLDDLSTGTPQAVPAGAEFVRGGLGHAVDRLITGEAAAHGPAAVSLRYFNVAGAHVGHGDPAVLVASAARAHERLGWRPRHAGLDSTVADAWAFAREVTV